MSYLDTGEHPVERRTPLVLCARYDEAFPTCSFEVRRWYACTVNGFYRGLTCAQLPCCSDLVGCKLRFRIPEPADDPPRRVPIIQRGPCLNSFVTVGRSESLDKFSGSKSAAAKYDGGARSALVLIPRHPALLHAPGQRRRVVVCDY